MSSRFGFGIETGAISPYLTPAPRHSSGSHSYLDLYIYIVSLFTSFFLNSVSLHFSSIMAEKTYQVVIVGGGIVGLSASLFLSSHNISHLLIERHATTSIHPRARGINTRAMEIFRTIGIDELVREAGANLAPSMGMFKGHSFVEVIEPRKRKEEDGNRGKMPVEWLAAGVSPVKGARCT